MPDSRLCREFYFPKTGCCTPGFPVHSLDPEPGKDRMDSIPRLTRITPTSTELDFLEDRLYEHNCRATKREDGQLFGFLIKDAQGTILAGLAGWTWAGACEIRSLWVQENCRGQGYGRRLIAAAEAEARAHGCRIILLTTYSFQAPDFYRKLGYAVAGKVDGFPPGHAYYTLVKQIDAEQAKG